MKKILLILSFVFVLVACKSIDNTITQVDLGMTKQEILLILGNDYAIETLADTPEGRLEVLRFPKVHNPAYFLHFMDGKLVEVQKDNYWQQQNINITQEKKE